MKAMKVALQKDMVNSKKYIKDLQTCHGEVQEYISKKKDELVFQGIKFNPIILYIYYTEYNGNTFFFKIYLL